MKLTFYIRNSLIIFSGVLAIGCSAVSNKPKNSQDQMDMSMGISENVKVVKNRTMMFHDISVTQTADGAELEGKVHVKGHQDYVPGHIDIAVIDNNTGKKVSIITTDFNSRIARHGRYNLRHPNNISTRLPGINPEKSTIVIAYHYSNVDRFSRTDCGANVALASIDDKK